MASCDVVMLTVHPDRFHATREVLDEGLSDFRGVLVNHSSHQIDAVGWTVLGDGCNHSYAEGLNLAFQHLESDRVLLISDDAHPRPGAIKAMLDHPDPIIGCVLVSSNGLVNHVGGDFQDGKWPVHLGRGASLDNLYPACHEVPWVTWACVLLDRKVIETVGEVDETYYYSHEDVDYGLRAREAGFGQPMLCCDAIVDHDEHGWPDTRRTIRKNVEHYIETWINSGRLQRVLDSERVPA